MLLVWKYYTICKQDVNTGQGGVQKAASTYPLAEKILYQAKQAHCLQFLKYWKKNAGIFFSSTSV